MTRLVLCIVALVAASVGQQQTPKSAGDIFDRVATQSSAKPSSGEIPPPPSGFTVDPSEVTPVSQSVQKKTVQNSRSKPSTALDMRPAAVCAREIRDEIQNIQRVNAKTEMGTKDFA